MFKPLNDSMGKSHHFKLDRQNTFYEFWLNEGEQITIPESQYNCNRRSMLFPCGAVEQELKLMFWTQPNGSWWMRVNEIKDVRLKPTINVNMHEANYEFCLSMGCIPGCWTTTEDCITSELCRGPESQRIVEQEIKFNQENKFSDGSNCKIILSDLLRGKIFAESHSANFVVEEGCSYCVKETPRSSCYYCYCRPSYKVNYQVIQDKVMFDINGITGESQIQNPYKVIMNENIWRFYFNSHTLFCCIPVPMKNIVYFTAISDSSIT